MALRRTVQLGSGLRPIKQVLDSFETMVDELQADHATNKTAVNAVVAKINALLSDRSMADQVLRSASAGAGAGVAADTNAQDIETGNAIVVQHRGMEFSHAAVAALDISAAGTCAGDTVAQSKSGAMWVFMGTDGGLDVETDKAAQDYDSAIEALAQYSIAANTLPVASDEVCIGCVQVTEGGSGAFTWGTDAIATETETFYSFWGLPGVLTAIASFALDAAAATFTYGAGTVRLGTGTVVTLTGKANVALQAGTVADGAVGAWLVYALADDVEVAVPLGVAYASLTAAQNAVRDHNPNPLLALIGVIYVANASGANFVGGTTNLDATGIICIFMKLGPESNQVEVGRAALNQPHSVVTDDHAATLTASAVDTLV